MDKHRRAERRGPGAWPFDDDVVALREFGTDRVHTLGKGSRLGISPSRRARANAERQVALVRRAIGLVGEGARRSASGDDAL
jgi:hypothetical protein